MRRHSMRACPLFALSLTLATHQYAAAEPQVVVVSADRMIDVISGQVIERPQITIRDGRISAIGRQGETVPAGAHRVELPGLTLLPGLIDMHVHLTADPRYSGYRGLEYTDNFWTVVGVANARKTLEAGFTTVRNVGSANYDDVALKQGIEQNEIPGPRIVPATYAIGATGGHCDWTEFPPSISAPAPAVADGAAAIRATVRDLRGRRHDRTCEPGRRGGLRPGETARHLVFDGHLQRRLYPCRRREKRRVPGIAREGTRNRAQAASDLPGGAEGGCEDGVRDRWRGLSQRHQRAAICEHGRVGHDPLAGYSGGDRECGRGAGPVGRRRRNRGRPLRRSDRGGRGSARRCEAASLDTVCDERGRGREGTGPLTEGIALGKRATAAVTASLAPNRDDERPKERPRAPGLPDLHRRQPAQTGLAF